MKESIVLISRNILIYNKISYDYKSFYEKIKLLKKRYIVVLDEDIYIKKVSTNLKDLVNIDIEKIKEESFGRDEEYLMDYKVCKKAGILYIYSIKGGIRISKLCDGANRVKIIPIQMYMMEKIRRKIKKKSYICIFSYNEIYYYNLILDGFLEEAHVFNDLENLMKKLVSIETCDVIYVESGIKKINLSDKIKAREVKLGGIFSEKVFV
ncbi:hypothetical protein [Clostridium sp. HBUAS56017]|uniref:hypothetical protein n=1 Tax=Clostridium sp. HBUAS56017 TaxID=2571128 RepID=UPI00117786B5|nr:hypothetical protein [Clostridium sp. HBUAS56017]